MRKKFTVKPVILWGILAIFVFGFISHSLYDLLGKNFLIGLFFPVNESIFEHTKLVTLPILLWFSIWYLTKKEEINADKFFTAALISMVVSIVSIPMLYYFYSEAFGLHLIIVDILILLVALFFGQSLAAHFYKYSKGINYITALILMIGIIVIFAFLTVFPPKLPLFLSMGEKYGM